MQLCFFIAPVGMARSRYYVSSAGNDNNSGTIDQPFLTVAKAHSVMVAGDTIYVRGGIYNLSYTISLSSKTGADSTKRCCLFAYPGERPIFDFSAQTTSDGIKVNGNYWYLRGIESRNAAHNGIAVNGSYNIIENCSVYENRNTGLQLGNGASYNRIINCDSYYNFDPPLGGNADGFAPKLDVGTGNYFYGCRSWQNSDDGWDGYLRPSDNVSTTLDNCWSFMNGYLKDGSQIVTGNGNGFKMGGGDSGNADSLRHNMILRNCLTFDNRVKGFDQNNNRGSMTLLNCTAYRNGTYNFSIPGIRRVGATVSLMNCVSFASNGVTIVNPTVLATNSWMSPFVTSIADFLSLDTIGVRGPRKPDGSLPDIAFMHLVLGSQFVDAGTNVGIPFNGLAPDLGAFETQPPTGVSERIGQEPDLTLLQNHPNPFNPRTFIRFQLPNTAFASLKIYDTMGREIATLKEGVMEAGSHEVMFDGSHCASGMYIARLISGHASQTVRLLLVK